MRSITQQATRKEEDKISEIAYHVLNQVFGQEATHIIYRYLETNHSLKPNEISDKIDVFAKGLEEFLSSGAQVVERKILEDIYSSYGLLRRLELERTQEEHDFVGQIRLLTQKT